VNNYKFDWFVEASYFFAQEGFIPQIKGHRLHRVLWLKSRTKSGTGTTGSE
jgi:hypothetical protein